MSSTRTATTTTTGGLTGAATVGGIPQPLQQNNNNSSGSNNNSGVNNNDINLPSNSENPVSSGGSAAIMARLDAYLPTLNTGMMDVRVQDAILKYPIVRSLIIPECDLEARRRCISLITKVLNAATPVLPLILQEQTHLNNNANYNRPPIPVLSLDAQTKVMTIISTMAERDRLIRFWMNHHVNNKGAKPTGEEELPPTIALYTKIKQSKEILSDLADRIQGAICIVFWECWDEIYPTLADIVGGDEMARADTGRIFRPSGEAALYINRLKVEKKHRMERERRESLAVNSSNGGGNGNGGMFASNSSSTSPPISVPMFEGNTAPASFWDSLNNGNNNNNNNNNNNTHNNTHNSTSSTGDSPASLMTDTSGSSWTTFQGAMPPSSSSIPHNNTNNHTNDNPADLQLIDSNELDYLMEEVYKNPAHHSNNNNSNNTSNSNNTNSHHVATAADPFNQIESPTSSGSHFHLQSQFDFGSEGSPTDLTSISGGTPKQQHHPPPHHQGQQQHLDLRKRIKMMEDGQLPEEHHDPISSIIW